MFGSFPPGRKVVFLGAVWTALFFFGPLASADTLALQPGAESADLPVIAVQEANSDGVRFTFELPALDVQSYDLDGRTFQTLAIAGGALHGEVGKPSLPTFTRFIEVPATAAVQVNATSVEEEVLSGYRLLPMQDLDGHQFAQNEAVYRQDAFTGSEVVTAGEPSIMRDLRVVPLRFSPVKFNPARGEIRVARRVEVEVTFCGTDLRNPKQPRAIPLTRDHDNLYRSLVVNYDYGRDGEYRSPATHLGTYVVISRNIQDVVNRLQPLLDWRRRMGYNVVHVTTDDIGSTSPVMIQNWLRDAYDQWDDPPEYIVMVGDASGTYGIGTFYETYSGYGGEGDHPYSQLDGADPVPDAFIGRLSFDSTTTLERIITKIVGYESAPYLADSGWFTRATLTGDPSTSGITCVQIMQWVKEKLLQLGYTRVDTVFTYPYRSTTLARLDNGNSFYGYRGYYNMSGISVTDILGLENGPMLTYAINLTCGTGSWAGGTSRNEAWLRAGVGTSTVTGGIGSIATATLGTHTRFNNCFFSGAAYGVLWDDQHKLGISQWRGKMEMILNYYGYQSGIAETYSYWNTLMGDPATPMWTAFPEPLTVGYPATVPIGSNQVTVSVTDGSSQPVEDAWVHLLGGSINIGGRTDAAGLVTLPIDASSSATVQVTVTGVNLYPHQGSFQIDTAENFVGLFTLLIDDDSTPPSYGNDDGVPNPGETIGIRPALKNYGTQIAQSVSYTLLSDDPYVTILDAGPIELGDINPGSVTLATDALTFAISPGCPAGHALDLQLQIRARPVSTWFSGLGLTAEGAELVFDSYTLHGVGVLLEPGEMGELEITLRNDGTYDAPGRITAHLFSDNYAIRVTDPECEFQTIPAGGSGSNGDDRFGIMSPNDCIPGGFAHLRVALETAGGVRDTAFLSLPVGGKTSYDPTGPDEYGYVAYDQTDTSYPEAPTYNWLDITSIGTSVGLTDYGWDQDDSRTMSLPFDFVFYGQTFDEITICSNGWIAMGQTYLTNYRNWHLPSAGGPANMIAPFWDNLYQAGSGVAYYWHDADNHRFVVAWDNVRNRNTGSTESFELILYDPAWYETPTGDGEILFQYETVNDNDNQQMYCTAGIQNEDHSSGLTYRYFHQSPAGSANFAAGLAVKFTTGSPEFASIGGRDPRVPLRLALGASEPNPWSSGTTIRFQLDRARLATLRIFDVDGRVVRTLNSGSMTAGDHALTWMGQDDSGRPVPSGIYYYRLDAGGQTATRQMIRIR